MSADGEINVSVNAEGVDEATGEMDGGGGDGGGPGVGVPRGGGGGAGATKLLGSVVALLSFLKPITDVLGVVSGVLQAFVAPLAITLLRLLQPALGLLIKILPAWFAVTSKINSFLDKYGAYLSPIPGLLNFIIENSDMIVSKAQGIIDRIVSLPGQIISGLQDVIPSAPDTSGIVDRGRGLLSRARDGVTGEGDSGGGNGAFANVVISGGLSPFVDGVTRDGSVDLF